MLAKAGLRGFGAYQQGMLSGVSQGLLGTDFGLGQQGLLADNQPGAPEAQEEQPTYSTNMMKIPMTMYDKPLKMLTPYKMSYVAKNMKASEAETAMKMQDVSGSSSLMFTEEGLNKLPDDIPGKFGDIVREEKQNLKNK